jgi:hypothetical protein
MNRGSMPGCQRQESDGNVDGNFGFRWVRLGLDTTKSVARPESLAGQMSWAKGTRTGACEVIEGVGRLQGDGCLPCTAKQDGSRGALGRGRQSSRLVLFDLDPVFLRYRGPPPPTSHAKTERPFRDSLSPQVRDNGCSRRRAGAWYCIELGVDAQARCVSDTENESWAEAVEIVTAFFLDRFSGQLCS